MTPFDRRDAHRPPRDVRNADRAADGSSDEMEVEAASASIVETRSQLSETLDAIEDRLNPDRIKEQAREIVSEATEQAKAALREATIGRAEAAMNEAMRTTRGAGTTMLDTIKQNPIPAAMIGIGLGWLLFKGQSNNQSDQRFAYRGAASSGMDRQGRLWTSGAGGYSGTGGYSGYGSYSGENRSGDWDDSSGLTDRIQDTAGQAVGQAQDAAGRAVGQVQDAAGRVADNLGDTMGGLQQTTQEFAGNAQDGILRLMHDSPLVAGGIAIAAGMVVGLALPETEQEKELMGEARDSLMEQVKESARGAQQRIQDAVGQVGEPAQ
jgi:ElaB/YqjD/DUF883 family membrane-anchored ribosome-binding protein